MIDPTKAIMSWEQADQIMQDQRAEIERLRLTDAEREAIAAAIAEVDYEGRPPSLTRMRDTLRGLLERTKCATSKNQ